MAKYSPEDLKEFPVDNILAPGKYIATIQKCSLGTSKNTGRPFINLQLKITDGPDQGGFSPVGKVEFASLYFTQSHDAEGTRKMMMGRINSFVNSLEEPVTVDDESDDWCDDVKGQEIGFKYKHKKDKDTGDISGEVEKFFKAED